MEATHTTLSLSTENVPAAHPAASARQASRPSAVMVSSAMGGATRGLDSRICHFNECQLRHFNPWVITYYIGGGGGLAFKRRRHWHFVSV